MNTVESTRKTYQIFKNWLIFNRGLSDARAEVCVSYIRNIDSGLSKKEYLEGQKTAYLYTMYQDILRLRDYKRSEQLKELKPIKEYIGRVFTAITDDSKLASMFDHVSQTKKKDLKNAFILYCEFLAYISEIFTIEDLYDGYIKRERIRKTKSEFSEQLSPEAFTRGIASALRKIGVFNTDLFPRSDKSAIGVPLDKLEEFANILLKLHGVTSNKTIGAFSFLCASGGSFKSRLWDLLVTEENICVDGERLIDADVKYILFDPDAATLIITTTNNQKHAISLPVMSSRRSTNRVLSFRVIFMNKMSEQAAYLNYIRHICYAIKRCLRVFIDMMSHSDEFAFEAVRKVDIVFLQDALNDLVEALKRYSQTFRIELIAE